MQIFPRYFRSLLLSSERSHLLQIRISLIRIFTLSTQIFHEPDTILPKQPNLNISQFLFSLYLHHLVQCSFDLTKNFIGFIVVIDAAAPSSGRYHFRNWNNLSNDPRWYSREISIVLVLLEQSYNHPRTPIEIRALVNAAFTTSPLFQPCDISAKFQRPKLV